MRLAPLVTSQRPLAFLSLSLVAVTNPVKKIFIGQLPADFVEQDLSDYFSQFGIVETIELVNPLFSLVISLFTLVVVLANGSGQKRTTSIWFCVFFVGENRRGSSTTTTSFNPRCID